MGIGSNFTHAKGKSSSADHGDVMVELVKGKETAILLQNLLLKQQLQQTADHHHHHHHHHDHVSSAQGLALQILASFTRTLSILTTSTTTTKASRDRRGSYKRRRTGDSRVTISPVMGDSYAWRKYGQKIILNSQYPRCYFRCTNKYDRGCKATKQVQVIQENPILYQTTYFNPHTCTSTTPATDDDNALVTTSTPPPTNPITELDIIHNSASETSLQDQWSALDFTWPEYEPNREDGFHSLDTDVNTFADIDNFHLDQIF